MSDLATSAMANIKEDILQCLADAAGGRDDPPPPSSYAVASIEMMAMSVFDNNRRLTSWMKERGLDPLKGPDAVLGVALLITLDAQKNPRFEPSEDDDFSFPDDHHH